ncbi:MAG: hypothetical protein U0Q16_08090 [Bryobacteraceae bacterium]
MKGSGLRAAASLALVFFAGTAVGALSFRLYSAHTVAAGAPARSADSFRQRYTGELKSRLGLNEDQVRELGSILDTTRTLYRQLHEKHRPEYDAIHQSQVEQVRNILTDSQRAEYEKFVKEREEQRRQKAGK